jgi:quaternary ammonium compound-resistance protein SugE
MAWFYLVLAGLFEVAWAIGLKQTEGWSRLWPSVWTAAAMVASFSLLATALKTLPLGTAYAIWTGIGAIGTVAYGMTFGGEPRDLVRVLCVAAIIGGIVGLKLAAPH